MSSRRVKAHSSHRGTLRRPNEYNAYAASIQPITHSYRNSSLRRARNAKATRNAQRRAMKLKPTHINNSNWTTYIRGMTLQKTRKLLHNIREKQRQNGLNRIPE